TVSRPPRASALGATGHRRGGARSIGLRHKRPTLLTAGQLRDIRVDVTLDVLNGASGVFGADASLSVATGHSLHSVVLIGIRTHVRVESSTREGWTMKIVVIGGTGLIGSKTVAILRQGGHEVIAASPQSGINTITGEGLKEVIPGAQVVIDLANSPSFE